MTVSKFIRLATLNEMTLEEASNGIVRELREATLKTAAKAGILLVKAGKITEREAAARLQEAASGGHR